jgi:cysteinyl-tRNA synthetase
MTETIDNLRMAQEDPMTLSVYNVLARKKEEFRPIQKGRVHMYVCGPTVYDHSHVGHAKLYISMDVIVRYLRYLGYTVRYVQNITDVGHLLDTGEDRIMKGVRRERVEPMELVERYTRLYFEDMDALGVLRPDISPRASGHVPEQIALAQTLIAKGHAYEVNGSVYFDVRSWPDYGKLSGRRVEDMDAGARVAVLAEKHHPADFALWKRAEPGHILQWDSPWGRGYPGWHAECTAMATKYLGQPFDIHGGGLENMFPHNECEIAQSEAVADGVPFSNYWLLAGSLTIDGVKMSKSLGNSVTIKEAIERWHPRVIRSFILSTHYRSPVDFSETAIDAAGKGWERINNTANRVRQALGGAQDGELDPEFGAFLTAEQDAFLEKMNDDFNAPAALGVLHDLTRGVNTILNAPEPPSRGTLEAIDRIYDELAGDVLGILARDAADSVSAEREAGLIDLLVEMRSTARQNRYWAEADRIRDRLSELGVILEDRPDGTAWRIAR